MSEYKRFEVGKCELKLGNKWGGGFMVHYPVSYTYNGLVTVKGKLYSGFKVPNPKVPDGFTLESAYCGLELNAQPPMATGVLYPIDEKRKVKKSELRTLLSMSNQ